MILRLVLFLFQETVATFLPPGAVLPVWLVMPAVVVFHGCIFVWQAVGLLRAAERYCQGSGQMFNLWGSQLALIVAAMWVLSYSLEAWHLTRPQTDTTMPSFAELDAERATRYRLSLSDDQTFVALEGSLELGITKRLSALLDAHPSVKTIRLTSPGGNVFEARGLAAQIQNRGLATSVESECSSACTLVFIGGDTRTVANRAKLGFHQYRFTSNAIFLAVDPDREQERDLEIFRRAGVAPWFLDKLYQSEAHSMWFPDIDDLVNAGVVTDILRPVER